jgi:ribose transport system permease protein
MRGLRLAVAQNRGFVGACLLLAVIYLGYHAMHPRGFSAAVLVQNANESVAIGFVAMAQTVPVLMGGLDLSVGAVMTLATCIASELVNGSPAQIVFGIVVTLACGAAFGLLNGLIVVYGRIQPIITTLATGAFYYGIALSIRPTPGGDINPDFADALTGQLPGGVPAVLALLLLVVLVVWVPWRRSVLGRAAYAIGSSEQAAYMSGVPIAKAKILAYVLAGLLSAIAGLLLTFITYSGAAKAALGADYTLNSIAAVVIGGTSLFGGSGSAIGSIFGAFVMRTVGDLLIVFDINPVLQPLFVGIVLMLAVSLGSLRLLRIKNRLDFYR